MKRNWIKKFFEQVFNPWSAENILDLLTAHKDDKVIKGIRAKKVIPDMDLTDDETLVTFAVGHHKLELLTSLIEAGADLNKKDGDGFLPIERAILKGDDKVACLLALQGANLDKVQKVDLLNDVLSQQMCYFFQFLVSEKRVDINQRDTMNQTPLQRAILEENEGMAKLLINQDAALDLKNAEGKTLLMMAAELGLDETVFRLMCAGADKFLKDNLGQTALDYAIYHKHFQSAEMLARAGVQFDKMLSNGNLLVEESIVNGYTNLADALIQHLDDVNLTDAYANSLLHQAVLYNRKEVVLSLLEKNAQIDILNGKGETPLMWAIQEKNKELASLLIEKGANVLIKNEKEEDAYHLAMKTGQKDMADLITKELLRRKKEEKGIEKKETVDLVGEGQPVVIQSGSLKIIRPIKAQGVYVNE